MLGRFHLRLKPAAAAPLDASARQDVGSPPTGVSQEVEFAAYAEDCRIFGFLRLQADRLSDQLNEQDDYPLHDVMFVALDDGHVTETNEVLVRRDEVLAVRAAGPRGNTGRRSRRRAQPVMVRTGPYTIHGYVHGPPGGDPVQQFRRGRGMVPLTDVWIEYPAIGQSHRGRVGTLIVNRDLVDWVALSRDAEVQIPDLPVETTPDPHAKDLTGYILTRSD